MKKTLLIAFMLGCLTSFATAGMKAGVTATGYMLDATGKESSTGGGADQSTSEDLEGATVSLFAEYYIEALNGVAIGIDIVPYDIDFGSVTNVRNGANGAQQSGGNQDNQVGTNSASVEMQHSTTAYFLLPHENGIYLKAGMSYANLAITETMTTGSSYPDEEIFGGHINIGYEHDLGEVFVRAEVGFSEWDTVKVKSNSGRNTVTADLDGTNARISIGKAF